MKKQPFEEWKKIAREKEPLIILDKVEWKKGGGRGWEERSKVNIY